MFFSAKNIAFYRDDYPSKPKDCVEISKKIHADLVSAQSNGYSISSDSDGNPIAVPGPGFDIEIKKKSAKAKLLKDFQTATGYVDCLCSNGKTYRMDAGPSHAARMDQGYRLALELGETAMDVIDYNDTHHVDVPISVANEIRLKQALDARQNFWMKWINLKEQISAAKSAAEIKAITWE